MKKRKNKRQKRIDKVIVVNITPKKRKIRILDLDESKKSIDDVKIPDDSRVNDKIIEKD